VHARACSRIAGSHLLRLVGYSGTRGRAEADERGSERGSKQGEADAEHLARRASKDEILAVLLGSFVSASSTLVRLIEAGHKKELPTGVIRCGSEAVLGLPEDAFRLFSRVHPQGSTRQYPCISPSWGILETKLHRPAWPGRRALWAFWARMTERFAKTRSIRGVLWEVVERTVDYIGRHGAHIHAELTFTQPLAVLTAA
jgi:hypothetical protein